MCPPPALNTSYATKKCSSDPRSYHCLWDGLKDEFIDICVPPEYYTPGKYNVLLLFMNRKEKYRINCSRIILSGQNEIVAETDYSRFTISRDCFWDNHTIKIFYYHAVR